MLSNLSTSISLDPGTQTSVFTVIPGNIPTITFTRQGGAIIGSARVDLLIMTIDEFVSTLEGLKSWMVEMKTESTLPLYQKFPYAYTLDQATNNHHASATLWGGLVVGMTWTKPPQQGDARTSRSVSTPMASV